MAVTVIPASPVDEKMDPGHLLSFYQEGINKIWKKTRTWVPEHYRLPLPVLGSRLDWLWN